MDMGLYMRVLDEAHGMGATVVTLENFGEPFLDPFFFERAAYAKGKGMSVFTVTNGSLFQKRLADKAVCLLDKIRFSVYGVTKEVYESIHLGLDFDSVVSNVRYLSDEKKRLKVSAPKIEVYFVLMEENKHQVEDFKKMWLGVADDIAIWKPHNWGDGRQYREPADKRRKTTCGRPERGPIQIQWDGLVVPCCFDYNSTIILGDLKKQSLYEVLTGESYRGLRKAFEKGTFSSYPYCDLCDQLVKREDVLVYATIKNAKVGAVNTTYDKIA